MAEAALAGGPDFAVMGQLRMARPVFRDVFRAALWLYPPAPMLVREATGPDCFSDRIVPQGHQIVISPWHLHRHDRLWNKTDGFDPARFATETDKQCLRKAFVPFSTDAGADGLSDGACTGGYLVGS